jgi:hypothetical protein
MCYCVEAPNPTHVLVPVEEWEGIRELLIGADSLLSLVLWRKHELEKEETRREIAELYPKIRRQWKGIKDAD